MMPADLDLRLPLHVYALFAALVGCLLLVHYLIYRHVRGLERAATSRAEPPPPAWVRELVIPPERGEVVGMDRLEAALARDPRRTDLVEILAHAYYCRRDLPRAFEAYQRVLDEDPDSERALFYL